MVQVQGDGNVVLTNRAQVSFDEVCRNPVNVKGVNDTSEKAVFVYFCSSANAIFIMIIFIMLLMILPLLICSLTRSRFS